MVYVYTLDPTIPPSPFVDSDDPSGREHYSPPILSTSVILNTAPYPPTKIITPTIKISKKFERTLCQTLDCYILAVLVNAQADAQSLVVLVPPQT